MLIKPQDRGPYITTDIADGTDSKMPTETARPCLWKPQRQRQILQAVCPGLRRLAARGCRLLGKERADSVFPTMDNAGRTSRCGSPTARMSNSAHVEAVLSTSSRFMYQSRAL